MKSLSEIILFLKHLARRSLFIMFLEFRNITSDLGVMLIFFGAIFVYPILYPLTYSREIVREIPVAVVDMNHSSYSRQLIRMLDATETVSVVQNLSGLQEARREFYNGSINGIMLIPQDFDKKILRGEQTSVSAYCDATYFLIYRQVFKGISMATGTLSAGIEIRRLTGKGMSEQAAMLSRDPVPIISYPLFNPAGGYATYVMPGVLLVILQQTLIMGIGLLGGTARERGAYHYLVPPGYEGRGVFALLLGKGSAYFLLYCMHSIYMFVILFRIFGYPNRGEFLVLAFFIFSYLSCIIALALALSALMNHRETAIATILVMTIPCILTTGFSWPTESTPMAIRFMASFLPSTHGVDAFLKITQMGASFSDVSGQLLNLWGLMILYSLCAIFILWRILETLRNSPQQ